MTTKNVDRPYRDLLQYTVGDVRKHLALSSNSSLL